MRPEAHRADFIEISDCYRGLAAQTDALQKTLQREDPED
jgi:hypothetical protein